MEYSVATYFLFFMILSCCGWMMEMSVQLVTHRRMINRGFLIGPYCPIYGFGGLFITLFLTQFKNYPVLLFVMAVVVCSALEYLTSYFMEKIFHARWWDYSQKRWNLHGRICLETSTAFGVLGILFVYLVNPFLFETLSQIPENTLNMIAATLVALFIVDIAVSFQIILNVKRTAKQFEKEGMKDNTEEISTKVREALRNQSFLDRRLVDAFPNLTAILKEKGKQIKQKTVEVKDGVVNKASEMKEEVACKASEMKDEITTKASKVKQKISTKAESVRKIKKEVTSKNNKK